MKKNYLLLFIFFSIVSKANAQLNYYRIQLKNKQENPFSINAPQRFLTPKALEKRIKYHIPIDSTDLPCTPIYINKIREIDSVKVLYSSKWLNQVTISTNDETALEKIKNFPFVSEVKLITYPATHTKNITPNTTSYNKPDQPSYIQQSLLNQPLANYYSYGQSFDQIHIHNGEFLHNHGFRGSGLLLCMTDGGFFKYKTSPAFEIIRNNDQIKGTWDFVANDTSVDEDHIHGSLCLSTIAANTPGTFIGTAPEASFYLFRTEDAFSETPVEEQNWVAAAEKADALGVDVISASLGYTTFDNPTLNHTYAEMDGNTTIISRAADLAAKKGMLVVVSAGNSGSDAWHFISAPADGDSVLTVGAVNTNRQVANFSSYGPSSDGQIKPDVAAVGWNAMVVNPSNGAPFSGNGTSFSCPNMAGLATCLWQAFPEVNNMGIIDALRQSADKYEQPDDRVGYGIPEMKKSFVILMNKLFSKNITFNNCKVNISFTEKIDTSITIDLQKNLNNEANYTTIKTWLGTDQFLLSNFNYADDLNDATNGILNYRLKVNISQDTTFYLNLAKINLSGKCNGNIISDENIAIGPNPVQNDLQVKIEITQPTKINITIHNAVGQIVYTNSNQQINNVAQYTIPFNNKNSGAYFVTVFLDNKKKIVKKIIH